MMAFIFVAFLMILANSQSFLLNGRHANKIPFLHAGVGGDINKFEEWEAAKMAAEKAYLTSTSDLDKQFWLLKLTSIQDAIKSESKRKKGDEVTSKRLGRGIKKLLWKQDSRSLFGPEGTIIPTPIKRHVHFDSSCGELVNRHKQLQAAWAAWTENWTESPDNKKILVVTGQMFGSGKTTFGRNLLNLDNIHVKAEFDKLLPSAAKTAMSSALSVYIDLRAEVEEVPHDIDFSGYSEFVSLLMWMCALEQCFAVDRSQSLQFWLEAKGSRIRTVPGCLDEISKLTGVATYFHFDEINAVEGPNFDRFDSKRASDTEGDAILRRYYSFWKAITPLLRNSFVYVSGKTVKLSEQGAGKMGHGQSPSRSRQLSLPRLEEGDIADILKAKYTSCFELQSNVELQSVSEHIFRWTSGIPRILEYTLKFLNSASDPATFLRDYSFALRGSESISLVTDDADDRDEERQEDAALVKSTDDQVFRYLVRNVPGLLPKFDLLSSDVMRLLGPVLYACACETSFDTESLFGDTGMTALDISELFSVYTTPTTDGLGITFLMPLVWKYCFQSDPKLSLFPYSSFWNINPYITDKASVLEELTISMLLLNSAFRSDGSINFIAETVSCVTTRNFTGLGTSGVHRMTENINANDNAVKLLDKCPDQTFIAKSVAKDAFVDSLILCKKESTDRVRYLVGIQAKAYFSDTKLGTTMLNKEIQKFSRFVDLSRKDIPEKAAESALFVMIFTGKCTSKVQRLRGQVWSNSTVNVEPRVSRKNSSEPDIYIPSGMQLLILSENQITTLLHRANLDKLKSL